MKKKVKEIYQGWKNLVVKNQDVEAVAADRMQICSVCPFRTDLFGVEVCGRCHCPLEAKTRSLYSECPAGMWPPIAFLP